MNNDQPSKTRLFVHSAIAGDLGAILFNEDAIRLWLNRGLYTLSLLIMLTIAWFFFMLCGWMIAGLQINLFPNQNRRWVIATLWITIAICSVLAWWVKKYM